MKGKILKPFILTALMFLLVLPGFSQNMGSSNENLSDEEVECMKLLSTYREFLRITLYEDALHFWKIVFNDCPASSEKMYLDGVNMYRTAIEVAPEGPAREGKIDTLLLIYDRRIENFGGEGNVLGRKGKDLLNYRGDDIEQVADAYEMLKKSVELEGIKSREYAMLLYISSGISLNNVGKIDDNQVIEDYLTVVGLLDQLEGKSTRWVKTRATIDEIILNEEILSCEALNGYYEPQYEQNKNDKVFLEKVIAFYKTSGCDNSDIYAAASETLYDIEPGPESAHNLAYLFITRNDFEKAASYLMEAVEGENIEAETKAEWYFELAVVSNALKEYCKAIKYSREAIKLKSDYGKAYVMLGDAYIASRGNLGDDFQQRTAFWAAADKYKKASSVDPSVAVEANKKLSDYISQYPNNEDVFFHDIKDGDKYLVGGCINENTTAKPGK